MKDGSLSRRRLLFAAGALSLAGCSALVGEDTTSPPGESSSSPGRTGDDSGETPTSEPNASVEIAEFAVTPEPARQTDTLSVRLTADNAGPGEFRGRARIDDGDAVLASENLVVAPGETKTITVDHEILRVGERQFGAEIRQNESVVGRERTTVRVRPYPSSFVSVDGTEFTLDGSSIYYCGSHAGGGLTLTEASDPETGYAYEDAFAGAHYVADSMQFSAEYGMNVMRIAAGPSTSGSDNVFHPAPGEFNETWFEHFDRIVAAAKRNGVRLVVSFLSNEDGHPTANPLVYAEWSDTVDDGLGDTEKWNAFFHDEEATGYHRELLEYVLTRENTITGVEYRNDPTILMWECGNETQYAGDRVGESLADWYDETARFIKSLDDNHLVGTGMYGSDERNDFIADHESDAIDACSIHLYPKYPNHSDLRAKPYDQPPTTDMTVGETKAHITEKVRQAHDELNKPIYLGEYGVFQYPEIYGWDLDTRRRFFQAMFDVAAEHDLNGTNVYALELILKFTGEAKITDGRDDFGIYPDEEDTLGVIEEYARTAEEKSGTTLD